MQQSVDEISAALQKLSEGERLAQLQKLVNQCGPQIFTDPGMIAKMPALFTLLSPDGQYALGQTLGKIANDHPESLRDLYRAAYDNQAAEKFYRLLSQIAVQE